MRRFNAWMWKEWREHRLVLLWTYATIPVLVALAFFAFGERLSFELVDLFPAIAVATPFLAVGLDTFSREMRRGTHALVLRTPGAHGTALAAKLVLLVLAAGAALCLEEAARAALTAWTDLPRTQRWVAREWHPDGEGVYGWEKVSHDPVRGLPASMLFTLEVFVAGLWATLASTWFARGMAASLAGLAWLGALAAPWIYLGSSRPWFWEPYGARHFPLFAGITALALGATAYGWLRGRRFLATGAGAARRGLLVTAAAAGIAYAAAGTAYARWIDVTPDVPELGIRSAYLGAGGRQLFLNVHRGEFWSGLYFDAEHEKGTPGIPWVVDLPTGAWRTLGELEEFVSMPKDAAIVNGGWRCADPLPWIVLERGNPRTAEEGHERWYSGVDATLRFHLKSNLHQSRSALVPMMRETLAALTKVRDARGRRAWLLYGHLEREGEAVQALGKTLPYARISQPVPGGWAIGADEWRDADGEMGSNVLDATTGTRRLAAVGDRAAYRILDPRRGLIARAPREGEVDDDAPREWQLADFETQELSPPLPGLTTTTTLGVVAMDLVLGAPAREGAPDEVVLTLWNPLTGATTPLLLDGEPASPLTAVQEPLALADGRTLVRAFRGPLVRTFPPISKGRPVLQGTMAWVVVDPVAKTARRVSAWSEDHQEPVAFEPSGSFLVIESMKRVVRFGKSPDERTVVFPRPAAGN